MSSDIDYGALNNNAILTNIKSTSSNSSLYDECPICLENLVRSIAITNCGHHFHFECLSNWIYSQKKIIFTCPSCNQNPCEIINVYSKKNSVSKLNENNSIDNSTLNEINNLDQNDDTRVVSNLDSNSVRTCCLCCIL